MEMGGVKNQFVVGVIVLALIGAVVTLTWVNKISGEAAVGFFSTLLTFVATGTVVTVTHTATLRSMGARMDSRQ